MKLRRPIPAAAVEPVLAPDPPAEPGVHPRHALACRVAGIPATHARAIAALHGDLASTATYVAAATAGMSAPDLRDVPVFDHARTAYGAAKAWHDVRRGGPCWYCSVDVPEQGRRERGDLPGWQNVAGHACCSWCASYVRGHGERELLSCVLSAAVGGAGDRLHGSFGRLLTAPPAAGLSSTTPWSFLDRAALREDVQRQGANLLRERRPGSEHPPGLPPVAWPPLARPVKPMPLAGQPLLDALADDDAARFEAELAVQRQYEANRAAAYARDPHPLAARAAADEDELRRRASQALANRSNARAASEREAAIRRAVNERAQRDYAEARSFAAKTLADPDASTEALGLVASKLDAARAALRRAKR